VDRQIRAGGSVRLDVGFEDSHIELGVGGLLGGVLEDHAHLNAETMIQPNKTTYNSDGHAGAADDHDHQGEAHENGGDAVTQEDRLANTQAFPSPEMMEVVGIGREDRLVVEFAANDGEQAIHHRQAENDDRGEDQRMVPFWPNSRIIHAADVSQEHRAGVAHEDEAG